MNFDFLIFPAPKFTDKEHPHGQLLWVPKYQRLYPDFMGYIPRRNKKQQIFFVQQQLDSSDEDRIHEVEEIMQVRLYMSEYNPQPVPKFNWKPIRNSGRDSPSMISSDDNSPEVLANKMTHLNSISVNQLISNIDAVSLVLDNSIRRNTRSSQIHNSISLSQPNIRLPETLYQKPLRSPLQKQKSQRSAFEMLGHIPCMYVDSGCMSPNIVLYFHGNAETVNQSYPFLLSLKNYFKISCLAIEYPGYGLYTDSSPNADQILNDAEYVYSYIIKRLGYAQECVIIFGRSIGSGPATYLASKYTPACLTLMSPFTSLQAVVRDYIGGWASHLVKQRFDNLANIREVRSPTLILHGKADELIPYKQAEELQRACGALCKLHLSEDMDHIQYKPNADLFQPMNTFLNQIHYFTNRSQGVKLPTNLFKVPHKD